MVHRRSSNRTFRGAITKYNFVIDEAMKHLPHLLITRHVIPGWFVTLGQRVWSALSQLPGPAQPREKDLKPEIKSELTMRSPRTLFAPSTEAEHDDDVEVQAKVLDPPGVALDEVVQLLRDSWEHGLKDSAPFLVLISQLKSLLAVGGGAEGSAARNEPEDFDCVRTLVDPDSSEESDAGSILASCCEGVSDAVSSVGSVDYSVRSVASYKERTNWYYRPRS